MPNVQNKSLLVELLNSQQQNIFHQEIIHSYPECGGKFYETIEEHTME